MCCGASSERFGAIPSAPLPPRSSIVEPPQIGERRVVVEREGTTAYLKLAWHAPAATDAGLLPDARARRRADRRQGPEPVVQFPRRAAAAQGRLYTSARRARARIDRVGGALLPTADPFLYTLSLTAMQGVRSRVARSGGPRRHRSGSRATASTRGRVARANRQLRARLVFETDSVTNVAHQLGYFETVAGPGFFDRPAVASGAVTAGRGLGRCAPPPRRRDAHGRLVPARGAQQS